MENYELEEIINHLNKPLFLNIVPNNHLIFIKYSNKRYYKYAFELLDTLTKKSNFQNKPKIFHTSLYYLLKILFNCGNIPYCSNYDLIILSCFFLGIKTVEEQTKMITITKLKNIYPEKYSFYENSEIKKCEMLIIYLLKYDINLLTIYDCICFLLKNETDIILKKEIFGELESKLLNEGVKYYIYKKPMDLAQEIISEKKQKYLNNNSNVFLTKRKLSKKININNIHNYKTFLNLGNEESPSTSASYGSGQKSIKKDKRIIDSDIKNKMSIKDFDKNIKISNNIKNSFSKNKTQSINIKLKSIPSKHKLNANNNVRYSEKEKQNHMSNIDYFSIKKNNNLFQSANMLANTFYKLNRTNNEKEINHDSNFSNIILCSNSYYNNDTNKNDTNNRNKSIFKKPLIKHKTSHNNFNNIFNKKSNNIPKKNRLCKNKNLIINNDGKKDNFIINKMNTNGNLYKLYKNCNNSFIKISSIFDSYDKYDNNNIYKYKNVNKIRGKTLFQKHNNI